MMMMRETMVVFRMMRFLVVLARQLRETMVCIEKTAMRHTRGE